MIKSVFCRYVGYALVFIMAVAAFVFSFAGGVYISSTAEAWMVYQGWLAPGEVTAAHGVVGVIWGTSAFLTVWVVFSFLSSFIRSYRAYKPLPESFLVWPKGVGRCYMMSDFSSITPKEELTETCPRCNGEGVVKRKT